jgi:hypothetical protein
MTDYSWRFIIIRKKSLAIFPISLQGPSIVARGDSRHHGVTTTHLLRVPTRHNPSAQSSTNPSRTVLDSWESLLHPSMSTYVQQALRTNSGRRGRALESSGTQDIKTLSSTVYRPLKVSHHAIAAIIAAPLIRVNKVRTKASEG